MASPNTIAVVGLGYVGLPLAIALAQHFNVYGYDIQRQRIQELRRGLDSTQEVTQKTLEATSLHLTDDSAVLANAQIYIVTVPTPITSEHKPDLRYLQQASQTLGPLLQAGDIVVYESTVYPGITETFCKPLLAEYATISAETFFVGYSPERINPGDQVHTVDKITKVVAGETPEVATCLQKIYGRINQDNIFVAASIKAAEAAKVIENAQRDINIAFINEVTKIMQALDLSVYDVLAAARTKWNFLNFSPGLVGGHCIGVDPYYLAACAEQLGLSTNVLLNGRKTNEEMPAYIAGCLTQELRKLGYGEGGRLLVLGLTFKENVPDLRNTKVVPLLRALEQQGYEVTVHDPIASPLEARRHYDMEITSTWSDVGGDYTGVVLAVPHKSYHTLSLQQLQQVLQPQGLVADLKNVWCNQEWRTQVHYWRL